MSNVPERFNTDRAGLCSALHWKSQYIWSAPDPTVPRSGDGLFLVRHDADLHWA